MKITNHDVIQDGEQELIDTITGDLDWGVMEEIFEKEHRLKINEDVEYKSGDIVIHNDQIAYRLEFDAKVTLSVLIDRNGSCLSLTSTADIHDTENEKGDAPGKEAEIPSAVDIDQQSEDTDAESLNDQEASKTVAESEEGIDGSDALEETLLPEDAQKKISQAALDASDIIKDINGDASLSASDRN